VLSKLAVNAKKGTVSFRLSRAVSVKLAVAKAREGRSVTIRRLTVRAKAGANSVRLKGRRLAIGTYRLTASPAGGTAHSVRFKVKRST
jgi:hypothetical protein